ncbi:hypothetical protein D3C81_1853090 [compost metagenome]
MAAFLGNAVLVHDDDPVGIFDRGQPVGNDQSGAADRQLGKRLLDGGLGLSVER